LLDLVRDPIASIIPTPLLSPAIFISSSEDVERRFFLRLLFVQSQLTQRVAIKIKIYCEMQTWIFHKIRNLAKRSQWLCYLALSFKLFTR